MTDENEEKSILKRYQHGVGSFLYLVKLSLPDITNYVRELRKCMNECNRDSYNQVLRVIDYFNMYKNYGLNLKCNQKMNENIYLKCYVDSDWGGNTFNRKRISVQIITFNVNPIMWRLKQKSILSQLSSEAEYIGTSESCKDVVFVIIIIEFLDLKSILQ